MIHTLQCYLWSPELLTDGKNYACVLWCTIVMAFLSPKASLLLVSTKESRPLVCESRTSGVGVGQRSRFLVVTEERTAFSSPFKTVMAHHCHTAVNPQNSGDRLYFLMK